MILAVDIGGTKTNLARFEFLAPGRVGPPNGFQSLHSAGFPTLTALLAEYLRREPGEVRAAAFGVAGAVVGDRVTASNLPWPVEPPGLARHLGLPQVHVINDLAATGYGVPALDSASLAPLQTGSAAPAANAGLLAAGTGLGESILVRTGAELVPVASEGGHADFAPRTDRDLLVFRALREQFGRVSYERVLSGPGLVHVARVLHEASGAGSAWRAHEAAHEGADPAAAGAKGADLAGSVSERALEGSCRACQDSLDLFVEAYGAEAGNLALRGLTLAGVYLGGGIAPKILPALRGGSFLEAFRRKDHLEPLLATVPVWVILEQRTAMIGAARYASLQRA
jgi:glucokinase